MSETFDAVIVGAGQAGPALAGRLVAAGQRVALIERGRLGGTCVNTGCTPTKALVASARVAHQVKRSSDYGVLSSNIEDDFALTMKRARTIAQSSRASLTEWLATLNGCTVIQGHATFTGPGQLLVADRRLKAEQVFLNVGTRPRRPDFPGLDRIVAHTNGSILRLEQRPHHLIVVGGSYVGLEFAQIFRRLGSAVTVVEQGPRLIGRETAPVSEAVRELLEAEGIEVRTQACCVGFDHSANGPVVELDCAEGRPTVTGSHVLLAVGRTPNTDDLGLTAAGVKVDDRGYILVNDRLETARQGIWALGDCNGRGAFTHTAYNDYEIVADNLLNNADRRVTDRIEAYALYVDPPLARAGLSVDQAIAAGHRVLVGRRPMSRVGRAVEKGETFGFMEICVDARSYAILGATLLGVGGDEAIHGLLALMYAKAPVSTLKHAVFIHPTVSELLPTIAGELVPAN